MSLISEVPFKNTKKHIKNCKNYFFKFAKNEKIKKLHKFIIKLILILILILDSVFLLISTVSLDLLHKPHKKL